VRRDAHYWIQRSIEAEEAERPKGKTGPAFHSQDDILNAPPIEYVIDGFLQKDQVTLLGGPPAAMKTYTALHVAKALLEGEGTFLFEQFRVSENVNRVIYLTPEASLTTFKSRLEKLRMLDYALGTDPRFLFSTISAQEPIHDLRDERLLPYINGADVILDTVVRFGDGDENSAADTREFSKALLELVSLGARTVIGIHHSPKGVKKELTLDNTLRGSGDYGAVAATVWRLEKIDDKKSQIYFECVKDRDFSVAPRPFILAARRDDGTSYLDVDGTFKMLKRPGDAPDFRTLRASTNGTKGGRQKVDVPPGIKQTIVNMHKVGKSNRAIEDVTGIGRNRISAIIRAAESLDVDRHRLTLGGIQPPSRLSVASCRLHRRVVAKPTRRFSSSPQPGDKVTTHGPHTGGNSCLTRTVVKSEDSRRA
jgi:hypothetical protein